MEQFARLEPQDVREYWEDEEQDFTPWLAERIESEESSDIEDVLELDLEVVATEKSVGRYSLDILAQTPNGDRKIVVENQLDNSDHDHLGKSIAYAAGVDADVIVWIADQFHDEHVDAVQWLNSNSRQGVDLFAIRIEVWKIGDSRPAVRLNPVQKPSEWRDKAQRDTSNLSPRKQLQQEFWTGFRDTIQSAPTDLSPREPYPSTYYNNPVGRSGFALQYRINVDDDLITCGLLIRDDAGAYEHLKNQRTEIETEIKDAIGEEVYWRPSETADKERFKILIEREANLHDEECWEDYYDWMIETGEVMKSTFAPRIREL